MDAIRNYKLGLYSALCITMVFLQSCQKYFDYEDGDSFEISIDGNELELKSVVATWSEYKNQDSIPYNWYTFRINSTHFNLRLKTLGGEYFPQLKSYPEYSGHELTISSNINGQNGPYEYLGGQLNIKEIDENTYSNAMIIQGDFKLTVVNSGLYPWMNQSDTIHVICDHFRVHALKSYAINE